MRRHLSYANVAATLALVFAMSGGAMAANSYLINSTKQINPKVLKKLKGNAGKAGTNGAAGANGAPGATGLAGTSGAAGAKGETGLKGEKGEPGSKGEPGEPGPLVTTLPSGKTLRGSFAVSEEATATSQVARADVSFPFPLAASPTAHVITVGGTPTTECPGSVESPQAEAGNLCIYAVQEVNLSKGIEVSDPTSGGSGASEFGWYARIEAATASGARAIGTWAVTAG
jgi:hypothetical protein